MTKKLSKIAELVIFAKANTHHREINLSNVPNFQAQQILAITRVDVRGALKIVSASAIRHAFSSHGDDSKESLRGQAGLQDSDFELLPDILLTPDSYEPGNPNTRPKKVAVLFKKKIKGQTYHVVMSLVSHKAGNEFVFTTMYIKK